MTNDLVMGVHITNLRLGSVVNSPREPKHVSNGRYLGSSSLSQFCHIDLFWRSILEGTNAQCCDVGDYHRNCSCSYRLKGER